MTVSEGICACGHLRWDLLGRGGRKPPSDCIVYSTAGWGALVFSDVLHGVFVHGTSCLAGFSDVYDHHGWDLD